MNTESDSVAVFCEVESRRVVWQFNVKSQFGTLVCAFYPDGLFASGFAALLEQESRTFSFGLEPNDTRRVSVRDYIENLLRDQIVIRVSEALAADALSQQIFKETVSALNGKAFFIQNPPTWEDLKGHQGPSKDRIAFLRHCRDAYEIWLKRNPGKNIYSFRPTKQKQCLANCWRGEAKYPNGISVQAIDDNLRRYDLSLEMVLHFCRLVSARSITPFA